MVQKPDLTLNRILAASDKISPRKATERVFRVSDFVSREEQAEIRLKNRKKKAASSITFDAIDSMIAEMIARFGYDFYLAWKDPANSDITTEKVVKLIEAERIRDHEQNFVLCNVIALALAGCQQPRKTKTAPKGMRSVQKILKNEEKILKQRNGNGK